MLRMANYGLYYPEVQLEKLIVKVWLPGGEVLSLRLHFWIRDKFPFMKL